MDEQIKDVETIDTDEAIYEDEDYEDPGLIGKIGLGVSAVAAGAAATFAFKNKDKIKAKFEEFKADRKAKKVQKHLDELAKLGWKNPTESKKTKKD